MIITDPITYVEDADEARVEHLGDLIAEECHALVPILTEALAAQWKATPRIQAPDAGSTSGGGGAPSNPTADIALDGQRLRLRAQVIRSEAILREAVIAVRGVRRGLERSLDAWDGRP